MPVNGKFVLDPDSKPLTTELLVYILFGGSTKEQFAQDLADGKYGDIYKDAEVNDNEPKSEIQQQAGEALPDLQDV